MASRKLTDLHPQLKPLAEKFEAECNAQGIDFLFTCTYRSPEEQNDLYAQGRSKPGKIVTNAQAGQSKHNFMVGVFPASKAFDVVPLRNGKPVWNATDPLWKTLGFIGKSIGLEWAGDWKRFREYPHFQLREDSK